MRPRCPILAVAPALLALGLLLGGCPDREGETWIGVWDGGVPGDDDTGDDDTGDDDTGDDDTGDDDTAPVDADGDGYDETVDCDDGNADTYPGAPELCDGEDNDCDETVPADEIDDDGDGSSECEGDCDDTSLVLNIKDLDQDGWTSCDGDCNDLDDTLNLDDDDGDTATTCDGDCDDDDATLNLLDLDGDGQDTCGGDCDDNDPSILDEDLDLDGYSPCGAPADCDDSDGDVHPFALEQCGLGVDDDCDGFVDEGCNGCPAYVDIAAVGSAETGEWSDPYLSIPDAIAGTFGICNEIDVLPGTYPDPLSVTGRAMTLRGVDGAAATEIDANLAAPAIEWTVGSLTLRGFTVSRGSGLAGGGLSLIQSSGDIADCVFEDNYCNFTGSGGAIHATQAPSLTVTDTVLRSNHCGANAPDNGGNGGGLFAQQTAVTLSGLTVVGNSAGDGGGISLHQCSGTVGQSLIARNIADDTEPGTGLHRGGGGVLLDGGSVSLENLLVVDNSSGDRGGGLVTVATAGNTTVTNCTVAHNDALAGGAGVHLDPTGSVVLRNTIIAFNDGASGIDANASVDAPAQAYCDVYGNTAMEYGPSLGDLTGVDGNLSVDPQFTAFTDNGDPLDDDYHLLPGSGAIDAGDPDPGLDDPDGTRSDMGAYGGPGGDW